jgi:hypothetical protein
MRTIASLPISISLGLILLPIPAIGFDFLAHEAMSRNAVLNSKLDNVLKDQLGIAGGYTEPFNGTPAIELVANGSRLEDSPAVRVRHHFHNPTRAWNDAGLRVTGVQIGESSVLWSQNPGQSVGGKHSWQDARSSFFQALTATTDGERQTAYANTFQTVGHLTHLVQDAANPAHSRNDSHLTFFDNDGFHTWAEINLGLISSSLPFDPAILGLPSNPLAPIPIARIIDTESFRQTGVPQAGLNIGIAEYSNANFFSDDTIFRDFPFPAATSVELGPPEWVQLTPQVQEQRRYFRKIRDGEVVNHLAVPSALYDDLQLALTDQNIGLDNKVFQDYGALLFPRAVGYSAGLLDYFFRGTIDIVEDSNITGSFVINNLGPEDVNGTFSLYYDDVNGVRNLVPGATWGLAIPANGQSKTLTFTAPITPVPAEAKKYLLVFKGDMGQEVQTAIAAKWVTLNQRLYNMDSLTWYRVYINDTTFYEATTRRAALDLAWATTVFQGSGVIHDVFGNGSWRCVVIRMPDGSLIGGADSNHAVWVGYEYALGFPKPGDGPSGQPYLSVVIWPDRSTYAPLDDCREFLGIF